MAVRLVAGLGNPGPRYAHTRHNLGFRVVDLVGRRWGVSWSTTPCAAIATSARHPVLVKPLGYMNRSGEALSAVLTGHEISAEDALVVVDDVDLPLGTLRLRPSGGPGTHNGMRDLCEHLGTGFPRLRLGVRGEAPWDDLAAYVLSGFEDAEAPAVERVLTAAADAIELVCRDGVEAAMNRVNRRVPRQTERDPGG